MKKNYCKYPETLGDKEWLEEKYLSGLSMEKIADIIDCSTLTVYTWIKKHGIKSRTYSEALKGRPSPMKGRSHSETTKKLFSEMRKGERNSMFGSHRVGSLNPFYGKRHSDEMRKAVSKRRKGARATLDTRMKQSESRKGPKNYNWKGGLSEGNKLIRQSFEYTKWRKDVYERDNFTCQHCGQWGGKLEADHIKPFCLFPDLRFDLNNGRTLCHECHKKTDTYGIKALSYTT